MPEMGKCGETSHHGKAVPAKGAAGHHGTAGAT